MPHPKNLELSLKKTVLGGVALSNVILQMITRCHTLLNNRTFPGKERYWRYCEIWSESLWSPLLGVTCTVSLIRFVVPQGSLSPTSHTFRIQVSSVSPVHVEVGRCGDGIIELTFKKSLCLLPLSLQVIMSDKEDTENTENKEKKKARRSLLASLNEKTKSMSAKSFYGKKSKNDTKGKTSEPKPSVSTLHKRKSTPGKTLSQMRRRKSLNTALKMLCSPQGKSFFLFS